MADRTESSIHVGAPPADVMAVIADLEAYPEWSSDVKSVEVLSSVEPDGRPYEARFVIDSGAFKDSYTLEYTWTGDEHVSWVMSEPGSLLKSMDGEYVLEADEGGTQLTYRLTVEVKIPMIGMIKRKAEKVIVDTALKGLKARVEG
ncbi:MAG TPA: SRPBCC family protein [Actinomycetes bacterium]|nr:SRPBCC family protein [Actinomycetes bacterium]